MSKRETIRLEGHLQAKFDLSRRPQRIHASADADPVYEMSVVIGTVDATSIAGEQAGHHTFRQIEVDEVADIVEADRGPDGEPLFESVGPCDRRVEGLQPRKLTWSGGARGTVGATPPSANSWAAVIRPFWMRTWPAGVGCPATLWLYWLMMVLIFPALMPRPKFPTVVPGIGSWVVPSPVKSVRKISPAPVPVLGTVSVVENGLSKWPMMPIWNPPYFHVATEDIWWVRSSVDGP